MVVMEDDVAFQIRRADWNAMWNRRMEMDTERGSGQDFYRRNAERSERRAEQLRNTAT